ncbi:MAG: hypothetical protein HQ495_02720 [Alphaproteobacteria bacterium]|nr:hypothetical protein [Alphaproteobacteria bacterium]
MMTSPTWGQIVTLQQAFSFGTIAIRSNAAVERLALNLNGTYSTTANILVIQPPQRAEFLGTGFQASTAISLSVADILLSEDGFGAGKTFTVSFVYLSDISTDVTGSATIFIAGTLITSGNGIPYDDRTFFGTASLIANY